MDERSSPECIMIFDLSNFGLWAVTDRQTDATKQIISPGFVVDDAVFIIINTFVMLILNFLLPL